MEEYPAWLPRGDLEGYVINPREESGRIFNLIAKGRPRRISHLTGEGKWKNIPLDCEEET